MIDATRNQAGAFTVVPGGGRHEQRLHQQPGGDAPEQVAVPEPPCPAESKD
jgi:hypothetical protein